MRRYKVARLAAGAALLGLLLWTPAYAAEGNDRVGDILFAQPFRLDKPYQHSWRKEQPSVASGYLLVLAVDPDFARPRQTAEPVLYVGNQTAERLNAADVSGRLVVIVPAPLNARGEVALDLSQAMIWFGSPDLPERVDAAGVSAENVSANRKGVKPLPEAKVRSALRRGGNLLRLPDREALERRAAQVIQEYSPNETDLIRGLMLSGK